MVTAAVNECLNRGVIDIVWLRELSDDPLKWYSTQNLKHRSKDHKGFFFLDLHDNELIYQLK